MDQFSHHILIFFQLMFFSPPIHIVKGVGGDVEEEEKAICSKPANIHLSK